MRLAKRQKIEPLLVPLSVRSAEVTRYNLRALLEGGTSGLPNAWLSEPSPAALLQPFVDDFACARSEHMEYQAVDVASACVETPDAVGDNVEISREERDATFGADAVDVEAEEASGQPVVPPSALDSVSAADPAGAQALPLLSSFEWEELDYADEDDESAHADAPMAAARNANRPVVEMDLFGEN